MGIGRLFGHLIKGKVLVVTAVGAILAGGATVAMAATPVGQKVVRTITGAHDTAQHTPRSPHDDAMADKQGTTARAKADNHNEKCPGLPEAQKLAATFS